MSHQLRLFDLTRHSALIVGAMLGVDHALIHAVCIAEGDQDVATPEPGARWWHPGADAKQRGDYSWGRMQVLTSTAYDLGYRHPRGLSLPLASDVGGLLEYGRPLVQPFRSIYYGTMYLRSRLREYPKWAAVDAYNKGSPAGDDTDYVRRVKAAYKGL